MGADGSKQNILIEYWCMHAFLKLFSSSFFSAFALKKENCFGQIFLIFNLFFKKFATEAAQQALLFKRPAVNQAKWWPQMVLSTRYVIQ